MPRRPIATLSSFRRLLCLSVAGSLGLAALNGCATKGGKISAFALLPPDEFAVSSNPPLTTPPGDALLPMPLDSEKSADNKKIAIATGADPAKQGAAAVFGEGANNEQLAIESQLSKNGLSDGDIALLREANALKPDADIRQQVTADLKARKNPFTEIGEYLASAFSSEKILTPEQKAVLDANSEKKNVARPGVILVN